MEKTCAACGLTKPVAQFDTKKSGRFGVSARCKPCQSEYRKGYYYSDAEKARAKSRAYFAANKADMVRKGVARVRARKDADPEYRAMLSTRSVVRARELRLQILVYYSEDPPYCACCREAHLEFLHLDHVNGDGAVQRKQKGSRGTLGTFYWIIRNGFPEGYRVLCANCNMARGRYGYCPHECE